ncbi:MAG: response regulator [Ectobacillus sp.]
MIKILIVDDHVLIRKGIKLLLESHQDLQVVGEAGDGAEALTLSIKYEPHVILMDLSMPDGLDGFTAIKEIRKQFPNVKIIVLTMHDEEIYIKKALMLKVNGYLLKNSHANDLHRAIMAVGRGERYFQTDIPLEEIEKKMSYPEDTQTVLTDREQDILRLTVLGYTNAQIAQKLSISPKTVESHKANIMQKLRLKGKHELIQYGIKNHYLDLAK